VTVYPFVVHLGGFTITGYGLMMMVAFLMSGWIFARELQRDGLRPEIAWDAVMWAVIGGIGGAKIYYALLVRDWTALYSRGGLVWYGGFMGGTLAVSLWIWWKRHPIGRLGDLIAAPLAAGYAIGRVGCFLVGDDYGLPTTLPWGVRFPQGSPPSTARFLEQEFHVTLPAGTAPETVMTVHPTQLYEVGLALIVFGICWRLAGRPHPTGRVLGVWCVLMGIERLVIELFRAKDDRFFGPMTLAQVISLTVIAAGAVLLARARTPATA